MMKLEWRAQYYDGESALARDVTVVLMSGALEIRRPLAQALLWPYDEVTQTQGFYEKDHVRLARGNVPSEILVIKEAGFIAALRSVAPDYSKRFQDPTRYRKKLISIAIVSLAALVIAPLVYFRSIPLLAAFAAEMVPAQWESRLGEQVVAELKGSSDECDSQLLKGSVAAILSRLDVAAGGHNYNFRIYIIDNPMVNAFAAPGGHIVIFRGLVEMTDSPEELAGVLAHEMQHVLEKHGLKGIFEQLSTRVLLSLILGEMEVVADVVSTMSYLSYSRGREAEADSLGMELLLEARIEPSGMVTFFEKLENMEADMPEFARYLSTHPLSKDRTEALSRLGPESALDVVPLVPRLDWQEVKTSCGQGGAP